MIVHVFEDVGEIGTTPRIRSLSCRSRQRHVEVATPGHVGSWRVPADGGPGHENRRRLCAGVRANLHDLLIGLPRVALSVRRCARSARSSGDLPVIVHAHQGPIAALGALLGAVVSRSTLVYEEHTLLEDYGGTERKKAVLRLAESWFAKMSVACICQTPEAAASFAARTGISAAKISVVPNGVDTDLFNRRKRSREAVELRQRLGLADCLTVAYAGFLDAGYNGVDEVLRAIPAVERIMPAVKFVFAGTGPLEPAVRDLSRTHRNVTFLGQLSQREVAALYAAVDVVCVYRTQPLVATDTLVPLKLLEAMASEAIVVAKVKPSWSRIVNAESAVLVEGDQSLADGIIRALEGDGRVRRVARVRVEEMTWAASAAKLDRLYSTAARK